MDDHLVAGEPVNLLIEALARIDFTETADGMVQGTARLEPELGLPFFRALMRVDAELLIQDANSLGQQSGEKRTDDQRRADAFVTLALRVLDGRKN